MLQKLMNKTIISLLIWLVCMPCMAAAETSKELEDALEKAKSYRDTMGMSNDEIRDQLSSEYGEKFTDEEADYAVSNLD